MIIRDDLSAGNDPFQDLVQIAGALRVASEKAHCLLDAVGGLAQRWPASLTQVSYSEFRKVIVFAGLAQAIIEDIVAHGEAIEMVAAELGLALEHHGACH